MTDAVTTVIIGAATTVLGAASLWLLSPIGAAIETQRTVESVRSSVIDVQSKQGDFERAAIARFDRLENKLDDSDKRQERRDEATRRRLDSMSDNMSSFKDLFVSRARADESEVFHNKAAAQKQAGPRPSLFKSGGKK